MVVTRNAWRHGDNKNSKYDNTDSLHDNKMVLKMKSESKSVRNFEIYII